MKAIRVDAYGGPEVLKLVDAPPPIPGEGEVMLRVHAAGVNFADVKMRRGDFPPPSGAPPFFPGSEVAGNIIYRGPGAERFGDTDKLIALLENGGGYATEVAVPERRLLKAPDDMSWEEAAAYGVNFLTAYCALTAHGRLETGEVVVVHAAGGGVGTAAVQIAYRIGAKVIAVAGEDEKLEWLKKLGASAVANYRTGDFREVVNAFTDGRGANVVLDSVGGETFERSLDALAPYGRLVHFGSASGSGSAFDADRLIGDNLSVVGLNMGAYFRQPGLMRDAMRFLNELHEQTGMRPVIAKVLPLAQAAEAHRLLENRQTFGKVVLTNVGA